MQWSNSVSDPTSDSKAVSKFTYSPLFWIEVVAVVAYILHETKRYILVGKQQHTRSGIRQWERLATKITKRLLKSELNTIKRFGIQVLKHR